MSGNRAQHLVYLRQTRRESRVLTAYCAAASVLSLAAWYLDFPRLLLLAIFGIAIYFGVLALVNLWASKKHDRMLKTNHAQGRVGTSIESEGDVVKAGDIVRHITLGDSHPTIRFVHMEDQGQAYLDCVEKLYNSIQLDTRRFLQLFNDFKARCEKQYPDHTDVLRGLKIDHLIVFSSRSQKDCVANVYFSGELGELWVSTYDDRGFADLIWA